MNTGVAGTASRSLASLRAVLLVLFALTSIGPLLVLVVQSLGGAWFFPALFPEHWTLGAWNLMKSGDALPGALGTSVGLAMATAIVACTVAIPLGRALARLRGWPRHVAAAAAFLPVAAPPLALGTGLQVMLIGLGLGGSAAGVLIAHSVPAIGYLTLLFLGTFTVFDARVEDESRTLGATRAQTWRRVTLPLLRPQIAEALIVGFLVSWTQFALTLVVGGGEVRALPLEVFAYVRAGQDQRAAVGALLLVIPPAAAFVWLRWAARRTVVPFS